ncbi:hypothetical protein LH449_10085, partial [Laribacter hongkongensis]|nr:hypothetical protein [Laribacter hongkongensis]
QSGKRVSIGLIRLAHIDKMYPLAQALYAQDAPDGSRIHLCVYHSQYPLLLRSAIERRLDAALTRHNPLALFSLPDIRARLDGCLAEDHLFIVLSSPVSEVGRDHSYSWVIAEPSSMRSLIQLSGRVRRHWPEVYTSQNLLILQHSLAAWLGNQPAYCRPGFENGSFALKAHDLATILPETDYRHPDARPRLLPRADLQPGYRLVDLEHAQLAADLNQTHTPPVGEVKALSLGYALPAAGPYHAPACMVPCKERNPSAKAMAKSGRWCCCRMAKAVSV